jgi:hypothetical protein
LLFARADELQAGKERTMNPRNLIGLLRSVAFGLFALFLLGNFVLGDRKPVYLIGAIAMGSMCLYCVAAARTSSGDDRDQ